jgi:hypothetical protein
MFQLADFSYFQTMNSTQNVSFVDEPWMLVGTGYFSNMLMNETNEADFDNYESNPFVDEHSQANEDSAVAPSQRPNHKRQKNFSTHEDEILVSGWLNISLDPITGKDQKSTTYWTRISEYFHKHKKCQSKRTISSLKHRWETIQRCVNKFCGCLTRIELRRKSGHTISDKVLTHFVILGLIQLLKFSISLMYVLGCDVCIGCGGMWFVQVRRPRWQSISAHALLEYIENTT